MSAYTQQTAKTKTAGADTSASPKESCIDPPDHLPMVLLLNNPTRLTEVAVQRGMSVLEVKEHHARLVKDGKARMDGKRFISLDEAGNDREPIIIDDLEG